jgi:hypothetical protein
MDNKLFGETLAKTMDRMDKYAERGDLDGWELAEVLVIAVLTRPTPDADELEPDSMESFTFVDGTTQIPHVQVGVLRLALDAAINPMKHEEE